MTELSEIGRLPAAEDNCAIAVRKLPAGMVIQANGASFVLSHTTLEGHRFAIRPIPKGAALLSWGKTFGRALHDIAPGQTVFNAGVLKELGSRSLDFELPDTPNFADDFSAYHFDAARFRPAPALPHESSPFSFMGLKRPGNRGVGTRNMVVLLGTNALVNGFVQQLARESRSMAADFAHVDDIVAVTHTEGSHAGGNNEEMLLRTLAGFLVHPNTGGVLAVDAGSRGVTNEMLREYAARHGYALDNVPHRFISLHGPFAVDMMLAKRMVECLLPRANEARRTSQPLGELKIALQCGGSDAFSGISGNPLAALVSKEVIAAGGSAVLAETDELIGAESYVLDKVRDAATAERFLATVARFQERVGWHGHSAHGNPTGGNKYRGLYNIYLKSLGAAAKRHPDVRLDSVLEYGERIGAAGYHFMDSPGNDLESIAGQVASGCNMIYFITGNGSITNFPFVPTIKIVTTSARYDLLAEEMDVNAGVYLDGTPLAELAEETRDLTLAVASGLQCAGEKAGHAQVQLWRDWPRSGRIEGDGITARPRPSGSPLAIETPSQTAEFAFSGWRSGEIVTDRVGLILPASLCSGQIARLAADHLNHLELGKEKRISRFAALVHTEGCGGSIEPEYINTMLGYLAHPLAASCLVLEHGCEISHNDFWRLQMEKAGLDRQKVGWASVQQDGGIERVLAKIEAWFTADIEKLPQPEAVTAGLGDVLLGLISDGAVDDNTAVALAVLCQQIAAAGGTAVLPQNDTLVANGAFAQTLPLPENPSATLAFAQHAAQPGFHLMANPARQWSETVTGLGAAGVELIVAMITTGAQQGHPFIPLLQVAPAGSSSDMDLVLGGDTQQRLAQFLAQIASVLSRQQMPKLSERNNVSFQITRGQLGVSL